VREQTFVFDGDANRLTSAGVQETNRRAVNTTIWVAVLVVVSGRCVKIHTFSYDYARAQTTATTTQFSSMREQLTLGIRLAVATWANRYLSLPCVTF
jgi:hypothetical protein